MLHNGPSDSPLWLLLQVIEGTVSDPFILNWLDLLCFLLSGQPASGTVTAEVAFMFNEWQAQLSGRPPWRPLGGLPGPPILNCRT